MEAQTGQTNEDPNPEGLWKAIHNPLIPAALLLRFFSTQIFSGVKF